MPSPLILTLALEPRAQAHFDRLRTQHFPAERNVIAAHLTLFHALAGTEEGPIVADLSAVAERRFDIEISGLRSLGHGVAYTISSARLIALRRRLAARWATMLTPQDRQGFQPHITIQNKVTPVKARALLATLQTGFAPFAVEAQGLSLWRYEGGPWSPVTTVPFDQGPFDPG